METRIQIDGVWIDDATKHYVPKPYLPDTNPWPPSPPQQGWECPRCRRINSPSMLQCTCKPGDDVGD